MIVGRSRKFRHVEFVSVDFDASEEPLGPFGVKCREADGVPNMVKPGATGWGHARMDPFISIPYPDSWDLSLIKVSFVPFSFFWIDKWIHLHLFLTFENTPQKRKGWSSLLTFYQGSSVHELRFDAGEWAVLDVKEGVCPYPHEDVVGAPGNSEPEWPPALEISAFHQRTVVEDSRKSNSLVQRALRIPGMRVESLLSPINRKQITHQLLLFVVTNGQCCTT